MIKNNTNYCGAEFSEGSYYRYKLWRIWDLNLPLVMCIGLNPSNANAVSDDPTIRTLAKALWHLKYGGFYMMNLYGLISSKPANLLTCPDPVGENDAKLAQVEKLCDDVIVCWGNFPQAEARIAEVLPRYPGALCFGRNKNGSPWHPLALMYKGIKSPTLQIYQP